jgi:hypothetical protein
MIDFSRGFWMTKTIKNPKQLTRADRTLLTSMRQMTLDGVRQALGRWLTKNEIEGLGHLHPAGILSLSAK